MFAICSYCVKCVIAAAHHPPFNLAIAAEQATSSMAYPAIKQRNVSEEC